MSAEKMVTEREAILRERAAYLKGGASQAICSHKGPSCEMCVLAAAIEYPLPKVIRPRRRVIQLPEGKVEFQVIDGQLQENYGLNWQNIKTLDLSRWTGDALAALGRLFADPTEEVDA